MSEIKQWSRTAGGNVDLAKGGWPEGMPRSYCNDQARDNMGALRTWFQDPEYRDLLQEGDGFSVQKLTDTSFEVTHNSTPTDATEHFPVGARIELSDSGTPGSEVYGWIVSATYSAPDTTVVVSFENGEVLPVPTNQARIHIAPTAGEAAFRNVGTAAEELPRNADLGTAAYKDEGPGNGLDADTIDGKHALQLASDAATRNWLRNTQFAIWQWGEPLTTRVHWDDKGADGWNVLSDGSSKCNYSIEETDLPSGIVGSAMKLTAASTTPSPNAEKFGAAQVLEKLDSLSLFGKTVSLSLYAKCSAIQIAKLRYAILVWNGTADAATDPVAAWGAEGVDPTWNANWTQMGATGEFTMLTTGWTKFTLDGIDLSSGLPSTPANLAFVFWQDDKDYTSGDYYLVTGAQLEVASTVGSYRPASIAEEWLQAQRYFRSTFGNRVAPVSNKGADSGEIHANTIATWRFDPPMAKEPTPTYYRVTAPGSTWNSGAAVGRLSITETGISIGGGSSTDSVHIVLDASITA